MGGCYCGVGAVGSAQLSLFKALFSYKNETCCNNRAARNMGADDPAVSPLTTWGKPQRPGSWQTLVLLAVCTPAAANHDRSPWDFEGFASPPAPPSPPLLPPSPPSPPPPPTPPLPPPSLSLAWEIHLSIALPMVGGFFLILGAYLFYRKLCATRSLCNWICFARTSMRPGGVSSTTVRSGHGTEPARAIVVGTKVDGSASELGSFAEVAMISGRVVGAGPFTSALPTLP